MKAKNLTPFSSTHQPENPGRKKGSKNRSTIARMILDLSVKVPDVLFETLQEIYPDISKNLSVEEIMVYSQVHRAIFKSDTAAFRAVLDTAYGTTNREIISLMDNEKTIKLTLNLETDFEQSSEDNIEDNT
jgi:hypothetical protein